MPRILLVEDNEMNRDMLSRRLGRRGFDVTLAVDGLEGLAAARSVRFDLILMDLSLPVIDGWVAIRRLRDDPDTRSTPIMALTAHAMAGDRERAVEAGCDDYDTKPVEFSRLISKIERLLQRCGPPSVPARSTPALRIDRRIPSLARLELKVSTDWIEILTQDDGVRDRTDLVEGLRSIGDLAREARSAIDRSCVKSPDSERPADPSEFAPAMLSPAHRIIRVCDSLERSMSLAPDSAAFLVHLSEIRKQAAQMIATVWQATADSGRAPG